MQQPAQDAQLQLLKASAETAVAAYKRWYNIASPTEKRHHGQAGLARADSFLSKIQAAANLFTAIGYIQALAREAANQGSIFNRGPGGHSFATFFLDGLLSQLRHDHPVRQLLVRSLPASATSFSDANVHRHHRRAALLALALALAVAQLEQLLNDAPAPVLSQEDVFHDLPRLVVRCTAEDKFLPSTRTDFGAEPASKDDETGNETGNGQLQQQVQVQQVQQPDGQQHIDHELRALGFEPYDDSGHFLKKSQQRAAAIYAIQRDVEDVREFFRHFLELVNGQQPSLDLIEYHVQETLRLTKEGTQDVVDAARYMGVEPAPEEPPSSPRSHNKHHKSQHASAITKTTLHRGANGGSNTVESPRQSWWEWFQAGWNTLLTFLGIRHTSSECPHSTSTTTRISESFGGGDSNVVPQADSAAHTSSHNSPKSQSFALQQGSDLKPPETDTNPCIHGSQFHV